MSGWVTLMVSAGLLIGTAGLLHAVARPFRQPKASLHDPRSAGVLRFLYSDRELQRVAHKLDQLDREEEAIVREIEQKEARLAEISALLPSRRASYRRRVDLRVDLD